MSATTTPAHRLSPLTRRRIAVFRAHRKAFWSLVGFVVMCVISLAAPLIANDKPLLIRYQQSWFFPLWVDYPETQFGGDFETLANYKDPYVADLIQAEGWMLWPPIPYRYNTHDTELGVPAPAPPTGRHWLGTDDQARDLVARCLYGLRTSLIFALALTLGSSAIGIAVGALQGYFGGKIDLIGQRFLEIWSGLPELYLLIILASLITPSAGWLLLLMLLFSWTKLVDLVRAECLRVRNFDYIKAARALGVPEVRIVWRHVLPNALVASLTYLPFIMAGAVTSLTALDFLGFGLPADSASLGELVRQGKNNLHAPWLGLTVFVLLSLMLTLVVFIGEGVRDAFDPRLKV
jgi:microcin C transport system permease protein